jgi:hypothetical protein
MNKKPEYIVKKENNNEIFSIMNFHNFEGKFLDFLKTKKLKLVYQESIIDSIGIIKNIDTIYETEQKFYLHVEDIDKGDKWSLTIYYNPDHYNELRFFTNQLNKQYEKTKIK